MSLFEIFHDGRKMLDVEFTGVPLELGRDTGAAIRLDDPLVSRTHARIYALDGQLLVEDLGTKNGTFVNGRREYKRALKDGDRIELGHYMVRYRQFTGEAVPEPVEPAVPHGLGEEDDEFGGTTEMIGPGLYNRLRQEAAGKLEPHLELRGKGRTFPLKYSRVTIGTGDACQVRVEEAGRSEAAVLEKQPDGGFLVKKLGLLGSLVVNGRKQREARLVDGDVVELGEAAFVFRAGAK